MPLPTVQHMLKVRQFVPRLTVSFSTAYKWPPSCAFSLSSRLEKGQLGLNHGGSDHVHTSKRSNGEGRHHRSLAADWRGNPERVPRTGLRRRGEFPTDE